MNDTVQNQQSTQPKSKISSIGGMLQSKLRGSAQGSTKIPTQISAQTPVKSVLSSSKSSTSNNNKNNTSHKLNMFESVLDEIQNTVPHGIVKAVDKVTDTLNPQQASGRSAKEKLEVGKTPDTTSIDAGGGVQTIEQEKNPEIPVEVESFLQRVEDHHETAPTEIIIADGTGEVSSNNYPSRPVIVLPITEKEAKKGAKKSPKLSFRWLVEFSEKVVKMFTGKVIYRQEEV